VSKPQTSAKQLLARYESKGLWLSGDSSSNCEYALMKERSGQGPCL